MRPQSTLPVGVYITLVFLSGLLVGAFGMRLYFVTSVNARLSLPRPTAEDFRHKQMHEMQQRLKLTPDQVTSINKVFDETRIRFQQIHSRIDPEMKQLRETQHADVRALLTPSQQVEYDRWRGEREKSPK